MMVVWVGYLIMVNRSVYTSLLLRIYVAKLPPARDWVYYTTLVKRQSHILLCMKALFKIKF